MDISGLDHMTHHSLPHQMMSFNTVELQKAAAEPNLHNITALHQSSGQASSAHPVAGTQPRERSASNQSVEEMICEEEVPSQVWKQPVSFTSRRINLLF